MESESVEKYKLVEDKDGGITLTGPEALSYLSSIDVTHLEENLCRDLEKLEDSLEDSEE